MGEKKIVAASESSNSVPLRVPRETIHGSVGPTIGLVGRSSQAQLLRAPSYIVENHLINTFVSGRRSLCARPSVEKPPQRSDN